MMRAFRCEAVERKSTAPLWGNDIFRCRGKPEGTAQVILRPVGEEKCLRSQQVK